MYGSDSADYTTVYWQLLPLLLLSAAFGRLQLSSAADLQVIGTKRMYGHKLAAQLKRRLRRRRRGGKGDEEQKDSRGTYCCYSATVTAAAAAAYHHRRRSLTLKADAQRRWSPN